MAIDLLLFDLDGTLLRTDDLEEFRGQDNLGLQSEKWISSLRRAYATGSRRRLYGEADLLRLGESRKLAVFTRSPRVYAHTLLQLAYPGVEWNSVWTFEDVSATKPNPEGILAAMSAAKVTDPARVAMIGDEHTDIVAAYRAGCWAFLDCQSWPSPKASQNYWALERIPDMVFNGPRELVHNLIDPICSLPALERLMQERPHNILENPRFVDVTHWASDHNVHVSYLGRMFTRDAALQSRISWHPLSREIVENKDAIKFPAHWVEAVLLFIFESWPIRNGRNTVVTVVPFKPGRQPRLECFLDQLSQAIKQDVRFCRSNISCISDVLAYTEGVRAHGSEHLTKEERLQNVKEHLVVKRPDSVEGKHVIVIDDVGTSGASMMYADKYLRDAGARNVHCVALAHAVGAS